METGTISEKIERGKHTTRHSELICIEEDTYIMDTPGFSSLYTNDFEKEELNIILRNLNRMRESVNFRDVIMYMNQIVR